MLDDYKLINCIIDISENLTNVNKYPLQYHTLFNSYDSPQVAIHIHISSDYSYSDVSIHSTDTDDATEVNQENPFAILESQNEELYIDDPKKALKGYYEREGNVIGITKIITIFH